MVKAPDPKDVMVFPSAAEFRAWLEKHHSSESEAWVGYYKKHVAKRSISYPESVDEAHPLPGRPREQPTRSLGGPGQTRNFGGQGTSRTAKENPSDSRTGLSTRRPAQTVAERSGR